MRIIILFFVFLLSAHVSANEYKWAVSGNYFNGYHSDPTQACVNANLSSRSAFYVTTFSRVQFQTELNFRCFYNEVPVGGGSNTERNLTNATRTGSQCPPEHIYNAQSGICEAPEPDKCESTAGNIVTHQHKIGLLGGPKTPPPGSICENECQYAFTYQAPKDVYRFVDPDASQRDNAYGSYTYKGNGVECTGGDTSNPSVFDQPPTVPPIDKKPEISHEQKCDQWVTNADGTASRSCTSKDQYKNPGQLNCDNAAAYLNCVPGKPAPEFQETNKTEQTKKETNADGSTKTETTTTTDKTSCKGAKPCTSTWATEKETSGTNPDGTPGDSDKECTGTACTPGDNNNDGIPDGEEEEEGVERTATIGSCDAEVACSGDAIDCAVLQEQKAQRCLAEENSDYPKYKSEVESQLTEEKYQLEKETVQVPGLLEGSTRFLPSGCPAPKSVSLSSGKSISIEFDLFCRFASGIAPVIVALALLFGALYVGRSFGGG